ncbi:hypothetical protein HZS_4352 [Henneguya salminicola]|nr:hypothetical protein HZS_4352 [Henneguya salminicola]
MGNLFFELNTQRNSGTNHSTTLVVHDHQFITVDGIHTNRSHVGAVKRKFRNITNKKEAIFNYYLAEYLFKGLILSQFLRIIKELDPNEND